DEHVAAVLRVDPHGVAVGVDALARRRVELLAAVRGLVLLHAEDVDVLVVGWIDADLAEIHGARVEAVDASPRFAAVGGLVDAAVFVGVGALVVLLVGGLSAVEGVIGAVLLGPAGAERSAAALAGESRPLAERHFHDL